MSHSPQETRQIGFFLGIHLTRGDVICLDGDLGAGKTTFSAGVGEGWGAESGLTSPTFVIVHQYERPRDKQTLYHLDAYRLETAGDVESIGFFDILDANAAVLIEWPEKINAWLPPDTLWIRFDMDETNEFSRTLTLQAGGNRSRTLLEALQTKFEK